MAIGYGCWALLSGCAPASVADGGGAHDAAVPHPDLAASVRTYHTDSVVGCGSAGFQTTLATAGQTVGLATLAATGTTAMCKTMNGPAQVVSYDVCYAESSGGAFAATRVTTEKYLSLTGVGLSLSPSGDPTIAYTGNAAGVMPAQLRCGASNLLLVSGKGGVFGMPRAVARINNPQNEALFRNLGIDATISALISFGPRIVKVISASPEMPSMCAT